MIVLRQVPAVGKSSVSRQQEAITSSRAKLTHNVRCSRAELVELLRVFSRFISRDVEKTPATARSCAPLIEMAPAPRNAGVSLVQVWQRLCMGGATDGAVNFQGAVAAKKTKRSDRLGKNPSPRSIQYVTGRSARRTGALRRIP